MTDRRRLDPSLLVGPVLAGLVAGAVVALLEAALRRLAGVSLVAELVADRVLPMIPVDAFLALLGRLGGPIAAKEEAFWGGFAGIVGAGVVAALAWERLRRRRSGGRLALAALAAVAGLTIAGLWPVLDANYAGAPPAVAVAIGVAGLLGMVALAALLLRALLPVATAPAAGRRRFLLAGAGLVLVAATGWLGGELFLDGAFGYDGMRLRARDRRPITAVEDFYVVTKNLVDPDVGPDLWRLEVAGAVEAPFTCTLAELRALPDQVQETTLECISNGVAYGLLSNGLWAGVPLSRLLARARPTAGARFLVLQGVDGYEAALPLDRGLRGDLLVAHSLNGAPLTRRHGAPARAVVPGAYGELSVKWLTRVEVTEREDPGYYARQGWRAEFVHTTSAIDSPVRGQVLRAGAPTAVRGVAYGGDRGVSRVEVSVNGGQTWAPARIDYARSPLAWALWSVEWTPGRPGPAGLVVRAYDGAGTAQEAAAHGFVPAGATGLHRVEVQVV